MHAVVQRDGRPQPSGEIGDAGSTPARMHHPTPRGRNVIIVSAMIVAALTAFVGWLAVSKTGRNRDDEIGRDL